MNNEIYAKKEKISSYELLTRSLLFFVAAPGTIIFFIPAILFDFKIPSIINIFSIPVPSLILWSIGLSAVIWSFQDFILKGFGTPMLTDPPKILTINGLYKYLRNPMYSGVIIALIGNIFYQYSIWLIIYSLVIIVSFHIFIILYEEPKLTEIYGNEYLEYKKSVKRWLTH